jgi:hypothetical protein
MKRLTMRIAENVYYSDNGKPLVAMEILDTPKVREVLKKLADYEDEAEKILTCCSKPCHMGKDIKLIEREYREGHEPYGQILAQYERQLEECPKICPRYQRV